ncbi:alpha/beta fold hydrolase [Amycolatopsis regifaucium]|uniref:Hydrolase n=1 Tax=Amycolatopsis regifaucium TaxID=546365 RepID=A0A154MYS5_9PSEU|nr:alpha/beta fold hydrolase [Amycolatopsis regifaucium]KZB88619.1 hydrolase [Amycolatopsis regifaucium]SFI53778.1 Esterase/lipase [Amycolatopsis regifaucium]
MLLVHGFASDGHTDWITTGWPAALTAAGREVLVPDLPAHGSSPALPDSLGAAALAAELTRLVSGLSEVDVVGYSLGARLSWELPARAPVRRLVLAGVSPFEPFGAVDVAAALAFAEGGKPPSDPLTGMIAHMITAPGRNPAALARCIEDLRAEPFSPVSGAVSVPTRFVAGAEDPVSQGIETLVELVPGADLVRVPGDHGGALRSLEFKAAVLEFLG